MKFEILQEQFLKGLSIVGKAVATRAQLPALSNVYIEAKNEGIVLSATDLELGISTKIVGKVDQVGVTTVPAKMLTDFVSSLPSGKVEFELDKESLVIKAGSFKGKLSTISAEEFPKLAEIKEQQGYVIKGEDFTKAVNSVVFAAAKDSLRPVLTGILFEQEASAIKMVATDGFRLGVRKLVAQGKSGTGKYLIPARAVSEVAKIGAEGEIKLVGISETQVAFVLGETTVITQLLDGNFPEYQKIVPKEFETNLDIAREELLSAVRTIHIFARDNSNMTRWTVSNSGIVMKSESPEKGEASAEVVASVEGEGGEIVFNAKFVLDFLQNSAAPTISFSMSDNLKPGAFREKGNEDYLYIVMPINA